MKDQEQKGEVGKIEVAFQSSVEADRQQSFSGYVADFLRIIQAKEVVEVGSDVQLKLALKLAPLCKRYYSVNLPGDTIRMRRWYKMGKEMGEIRNVELIGGNAMELSKLVPRADVVILHNVLLDLTGEDTALMWKYRRGEVECTDELWEGLISRFNQAEEQGYREFLKVANPGYIVTFGRPETGDKFMSFLADTLKIDPKNIERKKLLYDDLEDEWEAFIINNTQSS